MWYNDLNTKGDIAALDKWKSINEIVFLLRTGKRLHLYKDSKEKQVYFEKETFFYTESGIKYKISNIDKFLLELFLAGYKGSFV